MPPVITESLAVAPLASPLPVVAAAPQMIVGRAPVMGLSGPAVHTAPTHVPSGNVSHEQQNAAPAKNVATPALTPAEKRIQSLHGVSGAASNFWNMETMFGGMAALVGMGLAKIGFKQFGAAVKMVKSPFYALNRTTFEDIALLRSRTLSSAANVSQFTGGAANKWVSGLDQAAQNAARQDTALASRAMGFFEPARKRVGSLLERADKTRAGKTIGGGFKWFADWRVKANTHRVGKLAERATQQLDGFLKTPEAMLKAAQEAGKVADPKLLAEAEKIRSVFEPVGELVQKASSAVGLERVNLLKDAKALATSAVKDAGLIGSQAKEGFRLSSMLGRFAESGAALHAHEVAVQAGGLKDLVKNALKTAGRTNILAAVVAVGAAAGVGALWMNANNENTVAKNLLNDMAADMGDKNHPIILAATKENKGQEIGRYATAAAGSVAEGVTASFAGHPVMGMKASFAAMGAQMGLPMAAKMLVKNNTVLNVYGNLKKEEAGKLTDATGQVVQFQPSDKMQLYRHITALAIEAYAPTVKKGMGLYNKMNEPVTEALVLMNLPVRETLRTLADPQKFMALAEQANDKMEKAAQAKAEQAAAQPVRPTANAAKSMQGTHTERVVAQETAKAAAQLAPAAVPAATTGALHTERASARPTATSVLEQQRPAAHGERLLEKRLADLSQPQALQA